MLSSKAILNLFSDILFVEAKKDNSSLLKKKIFEPEISYYLFIP